MAHAASFPPHTSAYGFLRILDISSCTRRDLRWRWMTLEIVCGAIPIFLAIAVDVFPSIRSAAKI